MKRFLPFWGVLLLFLASSCNPEEQNTLQFQGKMQGEWRLNSVIDLSDNSTTYASELHYPRITITNNHLEWMETYYDASTEFDLYSRQEGTGVYEDDPFCDEEEDGPCFPVEVTEDVYYTTIDFMYIRLSSESLIMDPGKDSLVRTLAVTKISIEDPAAMYWEVQEGGRAYTYHFSKVQ